MTTFVWAAGRKNDSKLVSVSHEYILCYVKSVDTLREHSVKWRERKQGLDDIYREYDLLRKQYGSDDQTVERELNKWYKSLSPNDPAKNHSYYSKVDSRGIYYPDNISWPGGGGPKFDVIHPITGEIVKTPSGGWRYGEKVMEELIKNNKIAFGKDHTSVPCIKRYLTEHEFSAPYSVFYKDGRAATKRLRDLMGSDVFQNPKDEVIIQSLIQLCTDKDSIIMDFFSGSGTTAHSVFLQNQIDKGNRTFILIQIPDSIDSSKESSAKSKKIINNVIEFLGDKPHNICEIAEERIRRAGNKLGAQSIIDGKLDFGFRVFKLASSNMNDVFVESVNVKQKGIDAYASKFKKECTPEDLLIQSMLELGIELSTKIEEKTIEGTVFFDVDNGYLVAFLGTNYSESAITEVAKQMKPIYLVIRNDVEIEDDMLSNIEQIFKTYSPDTTIRLM